MHEESSRVTSCHPFFLRVFSSSLCAAVGDDRARGQDSLSYGVQSVAVPRPERPSEVPSTCHTVAGRLNSCFLVIDGFFLPLIH